MSGKSQEGARTETGGGRRRDSAFIQSREREVWLGLDSGWRVNTNNLTTYGRREENKIERSSIKFWKGGLFGKL